MDDQTRSQAAPSLQTDVRSFGMSSDRLVQAEEAQQQLHGSVFRCSSTESRSSVTALQRGATPPFLYLYNASLKTTPSKS